MGGRPDTKFKLLLRIADHLAREKKSLGERERKHIQTFKAYNTFKGEDKSFEEDKRGGRWMGENKAKWSQANRIDIAMTATRGLEKKK